jgi:hypothetical protein
VIDYDLRLLMPSTVSIELPESISGYATPRYGSPKDYQCRIEQKNTLVRDQDGRERVSSTTIYLASTVTIPLNARITLPDGRTPSIMSIESVQDEDGSYFTKVNT